MINKHCDLIYCNSLKQSKANAKLYLLTNNYFKFLFQFQKYFLDLFVILNNNAKKIDNKVVLTPCVLFSELLTQWAEATLLSKFFTFDNLSRSNPCFVINNFIHKEDILMKDIKKFLIAALSFMLLVSISCSNDNKTGGGGSDGVKLPSEHNGKTYKSKEPITSGGSDYTWLQIKDGDIYMSVGASQPTFTADDIYPIKNREGNTFSINDGSQEDKFVFSEDWSSCIYTSTPVGSSGGSPTTIEFSIVS